LLIRAAASPRGGAIRAVIAGEGEERERLAGLIRELGVSGRVALAGPINDVQLLDHLARCRAVCFPPLDEDYGFVTAEAFASAKAVVTCRDSGGPVELVEHGVNGFTTDPTPEDLAGALASLLEDRSRAETMGRAAAAAASRLSWRATVEALTR
jgi:glycosyltransferase involved in cell wall biosynthesis